MNMAVKSCEQRLLINEEIRSHQAWRGKLSGLIAEKNLRSLSVPFLYILREGEFSTETTTDYYVSFMLPDGSIRHQPFVITLTLEGWHYENSGVGGPYSNHTSIDDVLHLMMHCEEGANTPYTGELKLS